MYKKANELLIDVQNVVGLVSGTAVQTYSEPQIYASIQAIFDLVFKKRFWDELTGRHTITLNGVDGLATTNLSSFLTDWRDIENIWYADNSRQIVRAYNLDLLRQTGSDAAYWEPVQFDSTDPTAFVEKVVRFYPLTSTSTITIKCRTKPPKFLPTHYVPFDSAVIAHGAAWNMLENDGINPTAASKCQQMFDLMYSDLVATEGQADIGFGGGYTNVPLSIRPL